MGLFGKKTDWGSRDGDPPGKRGLFGFGAPQPIPDTFSRSQLSKIFKHWAKNINKRDMYFQEFINLPDWNLNPLVPRALEVLNPAVKKSLDLTREPILRLQDYINVYEKLRYYQKTANKLEFAFKMMDLNGDGSVDVDDLTGFFLMTTGLSEDACRYHARQFFDDRQTPILRVTHDQMEQELPMIDFCTKFDLPDPK